MRTLQTTGFPAALVFVLTACSTVDNPPLIFGQQHTVGISIGASPADQSGELTLGYKDRDIAVVPVSAQQSTGQRMPVQSTAEGGFTDALSVLGQFEVGAGGTKAEVALGKFFATGMAARVLSEGFSDMLSGRTGQPSADDAATQPVSATTEAAAVR